MRVRSRGGDVLSDSTRGHSRSRPVGRGGPTLWVSAGFLTLVATVFGIGLAATDVTRPLAAFASLCVIVAGSFVLLVRSFQRGARLTEEELIIVSWFWTYRVPFTVIDRGQQAYAAPSIATTKTCFRERSCG